MAGGALTLFQVMVAAAATTATVFEVPVIDEVVVSVAVMVWLPAVLEGWAEKVPTPLVRVELAGGTTARRWR